jgi:hypothetical protein
MGNSAHFSFSSLDMLHSERFPAYLSGKVCILSFCELYVSENHDILSGKTFFHSQHRIFHFTFKNNGFMLKDKLIFAH